jgi:hypothetical protein
LSTSVLNGYVFIQGCSDYLYNSKIVKLVFYGFGVTDTVVDINTDAIVAVAAANKALLHFLLGQS